MCDANEIVGGEPKPEMRSMTRRRAIEAAWRAILAPLLLGLLSFGPVRLR